MSVVDIKQLGHELAALIPENDPILNSHADLLEYAGYVEMVLASRRLFTRDPMDELMRVRALIDPKIRKQKKQRDKNFHQYNKSVSQRKELHKDGAAARAKQGLAVAVAIEKSYRSVKHQPRHEQAALIAKSIGRTARTVRRYLKKIRQN